MMWIYRVVKKVTEQELQVIKKRVEGATVGPWRLDLWDGLLISEVTKGVVLKAGQGRMIKAASEDVKFIAHAREDIPALIAEVERLREALEFYANERVYMANIGFRKEVSVDGGEKARKALKGDSK